MTCLLLVPIVLSILLLAAHFLHAGIIAVAALCPGLIVLLFIRKPWAARVVQIALILGALEWLQTLIDLAGQRMDAGRPWLRMTIILAVVICWTLCSAALFMCRRLKRRFNREPAG